MTQYKQLRRAYGFDEVAIVPGDITVNPDQTDIDLKIDRFTFPVPIVASAMDAVTDVSFAVLMSKLGGLAVLNLDGIQARYENPREILAEIARVPDAEVTALLQKIYSQPVKENLIGERIRAIKKAGETCAVSVQKELVLCDMCGEIISTKDHLRWLAERLGTKRYSNPTLLLISEEKLGSLDSTSPRPAMPSGRGDIIRVLCPHCRRHVVIREAWG